MKEIIGNLLKKENVRQNLSSLRQEIKDENALAEALKLLAGEDELLVSFMGAEDAKTRKNAVTFNQIAMKCVYEMFMNIISEKSTGKKSKYRWLTPEVISTYYAQSLCFITEGWIAQGMDDIEPKEMAEAYMYLITRSMDDILSEL